MEYRTLTIYKNKNDEADCRAYEKEFKNLLAGKCRSLTQDSIQIMYPNSDLEVNNAYGSGQKSLESADPNQYSPFDEGSVCPMPNFILC